MDDDPSADHEPEPNLELPRLRLPGFRRQQVRRSRAPDRPSNDQAARRPTLPGLVAAALAGLVVGAAGAGATYGGLSGCDAVNGTPSCGAPGLGILVAIAVGMVAIGALLLRICGTVEPLSTSFLGVGIVVVVVLAGLTGVIFSVWMFVAIPLVAAAAYVLAHWVTTRFVEPVEPPPGPDVR